MGRGVSGCGRGRRPSGGGAVCLVDRVLPPPAGPDGAGRRLAHPVAAARRRGGRRVRGVRLPADSGASGCARRGSRRCARPGGTGGRDRRPARRQRSAGARAPRPRPGPHRHGTDGGRVRLSRRRHVVGHRWRGRSDRHGRRVLRSDPRMHGAVRSGAGFGVDGSPRRVVRSPTRSAPVPRPMPRAPFSAAAGRRGLDQRRGHGRGGTSSPRRSAASGARARPVSAGRASPASRRRGAGRCRLPRRQPPRARSDARRGVARARARPAGRGVGVYPTGAAGGPDGDGATGVAGRRRGHLPRLRGCGRRALGG